MQQHGWTLLFHHQLIAQMMKLRAACGPKIESEGKLQIPLYMLVLRDLVGIEPLGGELVGGEVGVGELALRVLVEVLHVGMRRRRVEIIIDLLYVLAMIAVVACKSKKPFFQNHVFMIPKRKSKTNM